MRDSAYLGDLGGLARHWQLLRLDLRGTGSSAAPIDESSYRCDHLVRDVEALRRHLGVEKLSLLGHSAGANLALLYLAEHPERVTDLTLIAPSLTASGIPVSGDMRLAVARRRVDEPWFADAFEALDRVASGRGDESDWSAIAPFAYGRWDTTAQDHHAEGERQINERAAAHFGAEGAFDPPATKAQLRKYPGPVSLIAGEVDINSPLPAVRELAASFSNARLVVIPGAAHFPWLDEPELFADAFDSRITPSTPA